MFSKTNEHNKQTLLEIRMKELCNQANDSVTERKIWCYVELYYLFKYANENNINLSDDLNREYTPILDNLLRYYQVNDKDELKKMLCYDIGKEMMDNYAGESERSTFYCNEEQRRQFRVQVKRGRIVHPDGIHTVNLKTHKNSDIEPIFVVGTDGLLYTCLKEQAEAMLPGDKHFHHSSFFGGGNVLCGGMMLIEDGMLKEISNESGHYLPDVRNLLFALEYLASIGVNLTQTNVKLTYKVRDKLLEAVYPAHVFLQLAPMKGLCSRDDALAEMEFKAQNRKAIEVGSREADFLGSCMNLISEIRMDEAISSGQKDLLPVFCELAIGIYKEKVLGIPAESAEEYMEAMRMLMPRLLSAATDLGLEEEIVRDRLLDQINAASKDVHKPVAAEDLIPHEEKINVRPVKMIEIDADQYLNDFIAYLFTYDFHLGANKKEGNVFLTSPESKMTFNMVPAFAERMYKIAMDENISPMQRLAYIIHESIKVRFNKPEYEKLNPECRQFIRDMRNHLLFAKMAKTFFENPQGYRQVVKGPAKFTK